MPRTPATRPRKSASETRGLVVRRYGEKGRGYTYDGVKFVSVSKVCGILYKHLTDWAAREERKLAIASSVEIVGVIRRAVERQIVAGADPLQAFPGPNELAQMIDSEMGPKHAHEAASRTATGIGHLVHAAIERWFAWKLHASGDGPDPGAIIDLDGAALRSFNRFVEWANATDLEPICSELSTCCVEDRFGGTLDKIALVEGQPAILDWKTGNGIYLEHYLQISAYRRAYNSFAEGQVHGIPRVDRAYIVHLPKVEEDDEAHAIPVSTDELEHHYVTFQSLILPAYRVEEWKAARTIKERAA